MEIFISSDNLSPDDLIIQLENNSDWPTNNIELNLRKKSQIFRTTDPTIVVAIISGVSAILSAVIAGIFSVAKETKSKKIVIQDKGGRRYEFPSEKSKENIAKVLEIMQQMEVAKIEIKEDAKATLIHEEE